MATGWSPWPTDTTSLGGSDVLFLGNPTGISVYADQQTDAANTFLLRPRDSRAQML